ncbi:transcription initiation factor iia subunit 2 [Limosa lapponica baueri]|uniref:Transcription initiation factor iia subunit 2 n=1 Tax=Limosa lapponica baueri TaxID=1758121 RepID=A0A2I0T6F7_LIMLA|nr:transcription initiation factor iia subunit 2 [Limosa lapponica baueri]
MLDEGKLPISCFWEFNSAIQRLSSQDPGLDLALREHKHEQFLWGCFSFDVDPGYCKVPSQQITPQLALQVLLQFDKAINSALAQRVRNRVNFRFMQNALLK